MLMDIMIHGFSVDMTSPVQHKAYGWSEMEDLELQNCFRQHFQENNVPTLAECNMAVGLAKILNWTIKRRKCHRDSSACQDTHEERYL